MTRLNKGKTKHTMKNIVYILLAIASFILATVENPDGTLGWVSLIGIAAFVALTWRHLFGKAEEEAGYER